MVSNPLPTQIPTPPGSSCRFGASRNAIDPIAGQTGKPHRADPTA